MLTPGDDGLFHITQEQLDAELESAREEARQVVVKASEKIMVENYGRGIAELYTNDANGLEDEAKKILRTGKGDAFSRGVASGIKKAATFLRLVAAKYGPAGPGSNG